ncbi:OLC1v1021385C1 [Oldenlandia corymbosa var. corymbosa]|uniref:OLC1v1021385C1 n=1 Tax=Oldenlandia corymbosa var. corymbosa TaxID=529605 RepID=A0AAV1BVS8_OLDCO|nr:OLC1v1021385C1 [Oldenlandia corymbosa var. corymbosa]
MANKEKEDQAPFSPTNPSPSSFPSENQNPLEGMGSGQKNVDQLGLEMENNNSSSASMSHSPASVTPKTVKRFVPKRSVICRSTTSRWRQMHFETLSQNFKPIPFTPKRETLEMASKHKSFLTHLGLWDFLNLNFGHEIRTDLIKELVVCYNPGKFYSSVHGMRITLGPAALADALCLRPRRFVDGKLDKQDGVVLVTQDEASFLEELISKVLILNDEDCGVSNEDCVPKFSGSPKAIRFQDTYWAGMIWGMVKKELSKGKTLGNCYYASHLQLLLMHQKPQLFEMQEEENTVDKCFKRRRNFFERFTEEKKLCFESGDEKRRKCVVTDSEMDCPAVDSACYGTWNVSEAHKDIQEIHEDGVGVEGRLTDSVTYKMDDLSRAEIDCQPSTLISKEELGETNLYPGEMLAHAVNGEITVPHEILGPETEHSAIKKLSIECGQSKNDLVVNEEACQSDAVDSLDNREKLLPNSQVFLSEMKHVSESDIPSKATDCQERNTEENVEPKVSDVNNFLNLVSKESTEVTLNASEGSSGSQIVEERRKEKVMDLDQRAWRLVHCNREDVMKVEENAAGCVANYGNSHEVQCEREYDPTEDQVPEVECKASVGTSLDDAVENKANGAAPEASIGDSLELHCEKQDDSIEDKANEAASEANIGGSLEFCCEKENYIPEDKANDAECVVGVNNSLREELQNVQNQHELELQFKRGSDCIEGSLTDSGGDLMDSKEVALNVAADYNAKESTVSMDLLMTKDRPQREGSTDLFGGVNVLDETTEALSEANVGKSLDFHCKKENYVLEDKTYVTDWAVNVNVTLREELQNVQDQHELELQLKSVSDCKRGSLTDSGGHEMDSQEVAFAASNSIEEVESTAAMDMSMTQEAPKEGLQRKVSANFMSSGVDISDRQELSIDPVNFGPYHEKNGKKSVLESSGVEDMHAVNEVVDTSDDLSAMEMDPGRSKLRLMQCGKEDVKLKLLVNEAVCDAQPGDLLDNKEKELHKVDVSDEHSTECVGSLMEGVKREEPCQYTERSEGNHESLASGLHEVLAAGMNYTQVESTAMPGKNESGNVPKSEGVATACMYENKDQGECLMSEGFVLQHFAESNIEECPAPKETAPALGTLCGEKNQLAESSLYRSDDVQLTGMKDMIHNQPFYEIDHSFMVPPISSSNAPVQKLIPTFPGQALQNQDISGSGVSVKHFASDNGQYEHGAETERPIDYHESMDLDFISGQLDLWMTDLKNAAQRKVKATHERNAMLLKKLEEQSLLIQQRETLRQTEEVQKQKDNSKYERELHLMKDVLEGYRKALKENQKSFAKYRKKCRLPDQSLYMDHPNGGGRMMLVSDWKEVMQKRQEDAIEAMVKKFEEECIGKLEHHSKQIEGLELAVIGLKSKEAERTTSSSYIHPSNHHSRDFSLNRPSERMDFAQSDDPLGLGNSSASFSHSPDSKSQGKVSMDPLEIRTDLIKELVVCYDPEWPNWSKVYGAHINLGPAPLAHALSLRARRYKVVPKLNGQDCNVEISPVQASFLEQLIWGCLILKDGDSEVDSCGYIEKFCELVKEELLLKHQRPDLFEEENTVVRREESLEKLPEKKELCSEEEATELQSGADLVDEKYGVEQQMEDEKRRNNVTIDSGMDCQTVDSDNVTGNILEAPPMDYLKVDEGSTELMMTNTRRMFDLNTTYIE